MIGRVILAAAVCLLSTVASISDDALEQALRAIIQQELAKQRMAPPATAAPGSAQPDIGGQLRELTEAINRLESRLERVEAAVPSSVPSTQAEYTDPLPDNSTEETYCKNVPNVAVVGSWAITEGDIIVGTLGDRYSYAPGINPGSPRRWPNGTVPYEIDPSAWSRRADIEGAIGEWAAVTEREGATTTLLHFRPKTSQDKVHYIKFTEMPPSEGSGQLCGLSQVGMLPDRPNEIPVRCGKRTIMHEIGHAIGLFHEHTRDDRNQYVKINWQNIDTKFAKAPLAFCRVKYNQYIHKPPGEDLTKKYDFRSIMHYTVDSFAKPCNSQQLPKDCWTIQPLENALNGTGINAGQIGRLGEISEQDREAVRRLYRQKKPPPPQPTHPKMAWCCCCWRYRPIDCRPPQAWRHEYWRPHRLWSSGYFDDWDE